MRPTELKEVLEELDGGTFLDKVQKIVSDVAAASVNNESKGKITLELDMVPIKGSSQVNLIANIKYKKPRNRGELTETYRVSHPVFVNQGGKVTVVAEDPMKLAQQRDFVHDQHAAQHQAQQGEQSHD